VDGLNLSLVDDTLIGKFPVVVVTQDKYISAAVVVSSVMLGLSVAKDKTPEPLV
jgi:uncharacterized membrane protein YeiH